MLDVSEGQIINSRQGEVGIITLNRPDSFNCISPQIIAGIDCALTEFEADRTIKAVLIEAAGKNFCTGADLNVVTTGREGTGENLAQFIAAGHRVFRRLEVSPLPVVVALQGLCLAGGLELMLSCDIAIAGESAKFADQHGRFGLVAGWGGTQRLGRILGVRRALDLMLSVRWLDAAEAERWGLLNKVVPDAGLRSAALEYCTRLASRNPEATAAMKRLTRAGLDLSLEAGLELERREVLQALLKDNTSEGLAAFAERREPKFR